MLTNRFDKNISGSTRKTHFSDNSSPEKVCLTRQRLMFGKAEEVVNRVRKNRENKESSDLHKDMFNEGGLR